MTTEVFLLIYVILIIAMIIVEVWLLSNDKSTYLRICYKSLKSICEDSCAEKLPSGGKKLSNEISRFYDRYIQEMPQLKKYYSNVVVWIDAIIFKVDSGNRKASVLKQYTYELKTARDILEAENPFNKCEKYQQGILNDIEKMKTSDNEILVKNVVSRVEGEFLRLSGDIKKEP